MRAWGLAINSKGSDKTYIREQKELAKSMAKEQKKEQKANAYWQDVERKLKLDEYKIKAEDKYKTLSQQRVVNERLKSKYGINKKKDTFKSFTRYSKDILKSKIVPRYSQDQMNARPIPQNTYSNPFAHKSELEVYGDEGLTLFDGNKLQDDDTGSLFGFSKRRSR
jgi:hypothetical protein